MLLKPATPLTVLLLIAFVLLLLSCLSTPIVKGIPLATFKDVDYGVFGYCKGDTCTNIHVGYTSNDISSTGDDFNLPSSTRKSLSSILVIHPVAALMTLICLCLAAAAHFHGPSHSPRFLLALLILLLPTLLVTLLAFLVDILLFVPHLGWGGWIVLVATIILVSCGVVTCAMRRTLVSRKARKRRIAENAEMSGENHYNRQNAAATNPAPVVVPPEPKEVLVSHSFNSDTGPAFATFETQRRNSDDDRTPLNSRTPMNDILLPPDHRGTPYRTHQDELGNVPRGTSPYAAGPMPPNPSDPRLRPQYSNGSMGSRRSPAPPGFNGRGRGGYPPRGGRGGPYFGPRGPSPGAQGGPYTGTRGPSPGVQGGPYTGPRGPSPVAQGGPYTGPRGPSPVAQGGYMGPMTGPGGLGRGGMAPGRATPVGYDPDVRDFDSYDQPTSHPQEDPYWYGISQAPMRHPSPGPIGMAVSPEMGQAFEMTPQPPPKSQYQSDYHAHDSMDIEPHALSTIGNVSSPSPDRPPTHIYNPAEDDVAPTNWGSGHGHEPPDSSSHSHPVGPDYYEDVDPRFARRPSPPKEAALPPSLTPGHGNFF